MYVAGHVASAWLTAHRLFGARLDPRYAWLVAGSLAPDLVDKSQQWLGLTPYGRSVGHSVLLWSVLALMWLALVRRNTPSAAFLVGGALHLAVDLADDVVEGVERTGYAFSAWMGWPLTTPDMVNVAVPHAWPREEGIPTALELATVVFLLVFLMRARAR